MSNTNNLCEYCQVWPFKPLFNNRGKLSSKGDFYPGICVDIDPYERELCVFAVADTYEPGVVDAEIKIKYCPMCGRELKE